jgi:hypothetical protein
MCSGSGTQVGALCFRLILIFLLTAVPAAAQQTSSSVAPRAADEPKPGGQPAISSLPADSEKPFRAHVFWDRTNLWLFSGVAAGRTLDYFSTQNMLDRGRTEILLPGEIVRNHAGFAALEAAGTAASVGLACLLHRTGHHKLERWLSAGHTGVAMFGAAHNYAIRSYQYH